MSTPTVDINELGRVRRIKLKPNSSYIEALDRAMDATMEALRIVNASEDMQTRDRIRVISLLQAVSTRIAYVRGDKPEPVPA